MKITRKLFPSLLVLLLALSVYAQQGDQNIRRLAAPGKSWALEVSLPNFVVKQDQLRGDGKGRMMAAGNEKEGYIVSIFLEPIPHNENSSELRDAAAAEIRERSAKAAVKAGDLKTSEYKQIPTLEYFIKEFQGQQLNQKHLNAYFVNDGFWVDIHFSKVQFKPGDEKVFYSVLDTVRFTANDSASPDSRGYLQEGSAYFTQGNYRAAIEPYRKALELEKVNSRLDKNLWRALVDNLGMAYGITGDTKTAKETFEYGLSKDPDYPMFHYLMACSYAEMNDLDNAILYLKQAFARKQNIISGEQMPDPATDDSFKRFLKNEKFRAALKEINR